MTAVYVTGPNVAGFAFDVTPIAVAVVVTVGFEEEDGGLYI
jgi:hypothetical protein